MPGGREAVPDTIGLIKVDLVGRLSVKSVMGHFGVVLFDVEIDQLLELRDLHRGRIAPALRGRCEYVLGHVGLAQDWLDRTTRLSTLAR